MNAVDKAMTICKKYGIYEHNDHIQYVCRVCPSLIQFLNTEEDRYNISNICFAIKSASNLFTTHSFDIFETYKQYRHIKYPELFYILGTLGRIQDIASEFNIKVKKYPKNPSEYLKGLCQVNQDQTEVFFNPELEFSVGQYRFFAPKKRSDYFLYSRMHGNCLWDRYVDKVDGSINIIFMTKNDHDEYSDDNIILSVTVHDRGCGLIDRRARFNENPSDEQMVVIRKYIEILESKLMPAKLARTWQLTAS